MVTFDFSCVVKDPKERARIIDRVSVISYNAEKRAWLAEQTRLEEEKGIAKVVGEKE